MRVIAYNGFRGIELMETGKVIGNIYCGSRDFAAREVGYIVNRHYQQKGYAVETLSAVIAQAFREGAHRIYAECDPRNIPSWKLLEKAGLQREACFRQNIWFHRDRNGDPIWKDTFVYALRNEASPDYGDCRAKMFDAACPDEGRVCIHGEVID